MIIFIITLYLPHWKNNEKHEAGWEDKAAKTHIEEYQKVEDLELGLLEQTVAEKKYYAYN